ncbi:MAG: tripartite tricarboxylate transporter substrate-binding protein [Casimicrobiaceae bacterium]
MQRILLVLGCAIALPALAQGADRFATTPARSPDLPMVLIVPFPAGGSADQVGKVISSALGSALRRTVATRNVLPATGVAALSEVAEPSPAEIRIGYATSTQLIYGTLLRSRAAYNPSEDFDWIGIVGTFGSAVIGPQEKASTFEQWLTQLPQRSRQVRWAAGAPGSMSMLAAQFLSEVTGARAEIVSVTRADEGYQALRKGEIDAYFDGLPNALQEVVSIDGRILAVSSRERATALPSTPPRSAIAGQPKTSVYLRRSWYRIRKPSPFAQGSNRAGTESTGQALPVRNSRRWASNTAARTPKVHPRSWRRSFSAMPSCWRDFPIRNSAAGLVHFPATVDAGAARCSLIKRCASITQCFLTLYHTSAAHWILRSAGGGGALGASGT